MKKLPAFLNTPVKLVVTVGLSILVTEFFIIFLFEGIHRAILNQVGLWRVLFEFVDPVLLTAMVSPALYFLILRPMRGYQTELQQQLDELHTFQQLSIGRELRMKELVKENTALRNSLSAETAGDIPVASGSQEKPPHSAEQHASPQFPEDSQRSALLFMLEDLERSRQQVERAHREWMAALDRDPDPIFLHDKEFRILRCNRAYQQCAGIPFHEIIGQRYFEIFPKTGAPSPLCLRCMGEAAAVAEAEEEVAIGEAIYHARAFSIKDEQGVYLYSMHAFEDITKQKHLEQTVIDSEEHFRVLYESSRDAIMLVSPEQGFVGGNPATLALFGCRDEREFTALSPANASPEFQPDGSRSVVKAQEMMRLALEKGAHFFEWMHRRVDGTTFLADVQLTATTIDGKSVIEAIVRDISKRKQAEEALRESEEKFRKITGSAQDAIILMGADQRISFWNAAAEHIFGYTAAEALGQELHPLIAPLATQAAFAQGFRHFIESAEGPIVGKVIEMSALRKSGEEFPVELAVSATWLKGQWQAIGIVREISERRKAGEALRVSAIRHRLLFESSRDALMLLAPPSWKFTGANQSTLQLFGASSVAEFTALGPQDVSPERQPDGRPSSEKAQEMIATAMREGSHFFEWEHRRLDGQVFAADVLFTRMKVGEELFLQATVRDITEQKQAEQALKESEKLYRSLFDNMLNGLAYCQMIFEQEQPQDFIYLGVNAAFETLTGLKNVVGKRVSEVIPGIQQSDPELFEIYGRVSLSGKPEHFEMYVEGLQQWFSISVYCPAKGYFVAVFDVITERKQAEASIQHANRGLAALGEVNRELVRSTNENELLQAICRAMVKQAGYQMAWVGYAQHDERKSIKIMAYANHDGSYLDAVPLTWAEDEPGKLPSAQAILSGTTEVCQNIAKHPCVSPWCDEALRNGYAACIALPLMGGDNTVFGSLAVYADAVNAFTPTEISLLEEMAGDLAFGVRSLQIRQERDSALVKNQAQLVQLEESLEDTVRAIASIVEMRDPYTAGHQVRVADLAAAIARQMGLPEYQIHGIHLAGVVHDLGKIQTPAEILSKPGKINESEFNLIKNHAQAGYDILKGIHFPWPIAQMVWQHHERLDGSGYPQGLKGDAILLESRILSVADVVEAMYSHRPYRPGLGIDAALAEITKQRAIYYDPVVVDACLALFREQHYSFEK